jgi:hypothetical protein
MCRVPARDATYRVGYTSGGERQPMWTLILVTFVVSGTSTGGVGTTTAFLDFPSEIKCRAAADALVAVISSWQRARPWESEPLGYREFPSRPAANSGLRLRRLQSKWDRATPFMAPVARRILALRMQ